LIGGPHAGNLILSLRTVAAELSRGARIDTILWAEFSGYVVFRAVLVLACCLWAVWHVRTVALRDMPAPRRRPHVVPSFLWRPRIFDDPVLWKEILVNRTAPRHWFARALIPIVMAGSFAVVGFLFYGSHRWDDFAYRMNLWARIVGGVVILLVVLAVAACAAGSLSGERERQTLDSLLLTALTSEQIFHGKWFGCMLRPRGDGCGWGWSGRWPSRPMG
jgi:hypothetical protein